MAYQMAQRAVTVNEREGHSFISFRAFQKQSSTFLQQFTRFQLARPLRAVPQRQLGFLFSIVIEVHTHTHTTVLWPFSGTTRVSQYQKTQFTHSHLS